MEDKKVSKTVSSNDKTCPIGKTKEEATKKAKLLKSKKAAQDFKKRYFEYYDDIKISDRQDW